METGAQFYPTSGEYKSAGGNILTEVTCEAIKKCDRNQITFKAYWAEWLSLVTKIFPETTDQIIPKLKTSAVAATQSCTGGSDKTLCGITWYTSSFDGEEGIEQQMAVLGVLNAIMMPFKNSVQHTADTGGTSKSNPSAGTNHTDTIPVLNHITTGDRAGAGVLTAIFVAGWVLGVTWMIRGG